MLLGEHLQPTYRDSYEAERSMPTAFRLTPLRRITGFVRRGSARSE